MSLPYRYIRTDDDGFVADYYEIHVEGVTIDTWGMTVPEMPTDAIYDLYYNESDGLHWVKIADFEEPTLSETEQAILETAINTEYLVCLADLGL